MILELDPLAYLAGYYLGDGTMHDYGSLRPKCKPGVRILGCENDLARVVQACGLLGFEPKIIYPKRENHWYFTWPAAYLDTFLSLGLTPKKVIPETIMSKGREFKRWLVAGLWDSDGTVNLTPRKNPLWRPMVNVSYSSKEEELCNSLELILKEFGINSTLYKVSCRGFIGYQLRVPGDSQYLFRDTFVLQDYKQNKLLSLKGGRYHIRA